MKRCQRIHRNHCRITGQKGFTLMPIILMVMIAAAMIGAGAMIVGPMVKRGKAVETQKSLQGAVDAIASWSAQNGRLPTTAEFPGVVQTPNDARGNPFVYIVDNAETIIPVGANHAFCGRTTTQLTVGTTANIAFAILSRGENAAIQSTLNGALITNSTAANAASTIAIRQNDLAVWPTLDALKSRTGCYGSTRGRLKILNNELPKFCTGSTYRATLYADGGVPFAGGLYNWCIQGALPTGITAAPNTTCPAWSANLPNIQLSAVNVTGASQTVTFMVRDNNANTAQRRLPISLKSCIPPPGAQVSFANNLGNFKNVNPSGASNVTTNSTARTVTMGGNQTGINGWGCLWYPTPLALKDKTIRAFFQFSFLFNESDARSRTYADGFTFSLIESPLNLINVQNGNVCGGYGPYLGYAYDSQTRATPYIQGNSAALEFDVYPNNATYPPNLRDPAGYQNHVAVVKDAGNRHNGANPACPSNGCNYPGPPASNVRWLEDDNTILHSARLEVIAGYSDNTCKTLGAGGAYALIREWIDCTACDDLTANYTATLPMVTHCFSLPASMGNILFGFTSGTSAAPQSVEISNFGIASY